MNTVKKKQVDPLTSIPEADFPTHLHGQIMKRVFFAGYGKYLYLSTGVLFLNLGMLGREVWHTVSELRIHNIDTAMVKGFSAVPMHVFITLGITTAVTVYAFHIIWKMYKEYRVFAFAR
jgi:hypothetical protein